MNTKVFAYDTTLRDGSQAQGISFSVEDKLKIVRKLDELGIAYIEAGNPGSNPKDLEFFRRLGELNLKHAKITGFGSTCKVGANPAEDAQLASLLGANTPAVAIFGKTWDYHATAILRTTLDENLRMIRETIAFLKGKGKEVIFDAEHFFDGYKSNPDYALQALAAAVEGGADNLALCDTNGGSFPDEIFAITRTVVERFPGVSVGIHCHNDCELAVANSVRAVQAGATQVQGTINGIGERCGNANLCAIIPNLQLKLGFDVIPAANMATLTPVARFVSEVANMEHNDKAAYVGGDAFAHKGGMHVDAVNKNPVSYEHVTPDTVGNARKILMSEVAGRATILGKINEVDPALTKDSAETKAIIERLKELEHEGYQFESAESSFELLVRKMLGKFTPSFELKEFKVMVNEPSLNGVNSSAMIKIHVGGEDEITAAEGDGPVNALDRALRRALDRFYPELREMKLTDYKVRVLDSTQASAAKVRVLIESADAGSSWTTIGVSTDVIDASWRALVDAVEYKLARSRQG
ncbi:citramalate synthase [Uliginosibacterium aquaticum]|uniref:Citramalate synthase n=1 Tax=Uliginosibacterium aquaticum TaxID=2731212 RepID=A0ABX2IQN8_9RHOO|nr:citramalate synthase [Uliginosibacterium aquaticum]NSL56606.1 citramalate synthase [Uliginosibacterium aquaticum]